MAKQRKWVLVFTYKRMALCQDALYETIIQQIPVVVFNAAMLQSQIEKYIKTLHVGVVALCALITIRS